MTHFEDHDSRPCADTEGAFLSAAFAVSVMVLLVCFAVIPAAFAALGPAIDSLPRAARIFIGTIPPQALMLGSAGATALFFFRGPKFWEALGFVRWKPSYLTSVPVIELLALPVFGFSVVASETVMRSLGMDIRPPAVLEILLNCDSLAFHMVAFSAVVMAPVAEEVVFRRFIYCWMARHLGAAGSLVVTSALFAAIHQSALQFAALFLLAVLLQVLYIRSKSIYPCIILHFLQNSISVGCIYLVRVFKLETLAS